MDAKDIRNIQEAYMEVVENQQLDEVSDRKVRAVRDAREKQWNKQFGKNRVQDPTDDMVDKVDKLIDQRNKRTGSKVKKTTMGQLRDKYRKERLGEQVDIYDIILSHLLDEGYAETEESAHKIMVNMSEEWKESIVENVSSGRSKVRNVKQRVSSAEVITNTQRQNKIAQHFADHAAKKKAAGDEAHSAATKAGKSPSDAETARQRAHREYEKSMRG